ncbi:NTF2-like N-terminal transpeptidase domain-containing protein [Eubacterium sp. AF17-7]|jgi:hypothetical protein|uniref:NTF2-like N-terminal transpeptidase domain-containing protein n=1 Tax=Eubacterium TaxID=1730 RepID=UPI000E515FF3|nr:NTF2-like N-terminal transpeptidase domain-containing protein [Eubacterium sp. AF17-7]RGG67263.1 hypothetical protein DWW96_00950 [Eubacterium sp. AF17-7]
MIKKIINSNIVRLIGALLFLTVCAVIGAGLSYVNYESNPTDEAVAYFKAFLAQDYDTIYGLVNQPKNTYINKTAYTDRVKKIRESIVIDSYEISEPYKENGKKTVDIICNNETTETNQTIKLVFDEVKHGMQIIPDYKVDISKMLVKNVNFVVPTGDALYINGEVVTKDMAKVTTDANTNTDTYHFDKILYGAYDANAINRYSQIDLKPEIIQEGTTINFDATAYHANLEFEEKIKANADNMITQFYVNAREKKGNNKELKAYFANDKKLQKKVDKYLKETEEVLYWPETKNIDKYSVVSFEPGEMKHQSVYNNDNTFTVTYDFVYTYVSSTDTAIYTSYVYSIGGSCKTKMTLTYTLNEDQTLTLTDIKVKNKNQKEKGED